MTNKVYGWPAKKKEVARRRYKANKPQKKASSYLDLEEFPSLLLPAFFFVPLTNATTTTLKKVSFSQSSLSSDPKF